MLLVINADVSVNIAAWTNNCSTNFRNADSARTDVQMMASGAVLPFEIAIAVWTVLIDDLRHFCDEILACSKHKKWEERMKQLVRSLKFIT